MKAVNFEKYKFRCHALGRIMAGESLGLTPNQEKEYAALDARYKGEGLPLTEKQIQKHSELHAKKHKKPGLTDGVKTYLQELFKEAVFDRRKEIYSDTLYKGVAVEEMSITLYSTRVGKPFFKNKERRSNDYVTGEPDNVQGKIRDIKSSWDIHTFPIYDRKLPSRIYWWQVQGYMWLWGLDSAEVVYCLVDTPEELIQDAIRRYAWKMNYIDVPAEEEKKIRHSMTFGDIPEELRVRVFTIDFNPKAIDVLKKKIELCRKYMERLNKELIDRLQLID